jgi:hypothetical protein
VALNRKHDPKPKKRAQDNTRDGSQPQNEHGHQGVPSTTTTAIPLLCTISFAHYQALDTVLVSTCLNIHFIQANPRLSSQSVQRRIPSRMAQQTSNTGAAPASRGCRHAQEPTARARTRVHNCRNLILDFWVQAAIFHFCFILLAHHLYSLYFISHYTTYIYITYIQLLFILIGILLGLGARIEGVC